MTDLHTRILRWLDHAGRTQAELAAFVGVTPGAVCRWCSDEGPSYPRMTRIARIAEFFGVSVAHFLSYLPPESSPSSPASKAEG